MSGLKGRRGVGAFPRLYLKRDDGSDEVPRELLTLAWDMRAAIPKQASKSHRRNQRHRLTPLRNAENHDFKIERPSEKEKYIRINSF
jgi:hypothetical protein